MTYAVTVYLEADSAEHASAMVSLALTDAIPEREPVVEDVQHVDAE